MKLLDLNPFEVNFGDHGYALNWKQFENVDPYLMWHIANNGIKNPIIVYKPLGNDFLVKLLRRSFDKDVSLDGFWCWRGTQRIRIARLYNIPKIKALWLYENKGDAIDLSILRSYFHQPVRLVWSTFLHRWDVVIDHDFTIHTG